MTLLNQLIPLGWEAQIHRETYIAVFHSHLQERGTKQRFARDVGISPQYLSYLLDPYNHRTPSPATAEAMARALVMSDHERDHVLEHLICAGEREAEAAKVLRQALPQAGIGKAAAEICRLNEIVHFGDDPQEVQGKRRVTAQAAKTFLSTLDPWAFPQAYAEVALVMHELNSVLDHHSRALYYAKRARFVLLVASDAHNRDEPSERASTRASTMASVFTNATRLEAVAYSNMGLQRPAYRLLSEAERMADVRRNPAFWLPHLYRDKLNCLAHMTRASIAEAEALALRGVRALERSDVPQGALNALMLERGLTNVYLHTGRIAQATQVLERLHAEMADMAEIGTVHRMLVLKDYAHALWHQHKPAQWAEVIGDAVALAEEAGLAHQLGLLRLRYRFIPQDALALLSPLAREQLQPHSQLQVS